MVSKLFSPRLCVALCAHTTLFTSGSMQKLRKFDVELIAPKLASHLTSSGLFIAGQQIADVIQHIPSSWTLFWETFTDSDHIHHDLSHCHNFGNSPKCPFSIAALALRGSRSTSHRPVGSGDIGSKAPAIDDTSKLSGTPSKTSSGSGSVLREKRSG